MARRDPLAQFDVSPESGLSPFGRASRQAKERGLPTAKGIAPTKLPGGPQKGAIERIKKEPAYLARLKDLKVTGADWPRIDAEYDRIIDMLTTWSPPRLPEADDVRQLRVEDFQILGGQG